MNAVCRHCRKDCAHRLGILQCSTCANLGIWLNSMQRFSHAYLVCKCRCTAPAARTLNPWETGSLSISAVTTLGQGRLDDHGRNASTSAPADVVLNALPHPVIVVSSDGKVSDANAAAEAFFEVSVTHLRRHLLRDLVPFGSPLLTLVEQVRSAARPSTNTKSTSAPRAIRATGWSISTSRRCRSNRNPS